MRHYHLYNRLRRYLSVTTYCLIILLLVACGDDPESQKQSQPKDKSEVVVTLPEIQSISSPVEQNTSAKHDSKITFSHKSLADWQAIKERGSLRIIVPHQIQYNNILPRDSLSYNNELNLILRFAKHHNLIPVLITVEKFSNLFTSLEQGFGDIIVANITVTDSRKKNYQFSNPVTHTFEQLVMASSINQPIKINDLGQLKIGVRPHTSFWETVTTLKEQQPDIQLIELEQTITDEEKFNKLASGSIDAVLEDSNRLSLFMEYRNDIKPVLSLTSELPIAWALRKNNPQLLKQVNQFITTEKLLQHLPDARLGDLNKIKEAKQLRLITRNNASTYFMWKNQLMGFEYELIKKFAKQQKLNLKVLVAENNEQMFEWLKIGYGDIISAGLIKTEQRSRHPIIYSDPYLFVEQLVVQHKEDTPISSIQDFKDRTFYVRKSSSYWQTLNEIQSSLAKENIHFNIVPVPESVETEEIIQSVVNGQYDLTVADSHIIAIEKSWHSNLVANFSISEQNGHRWLVRKSATKLQEALNQFIKKQYKGLYYNITYNKYFNNSRKLFNAQKRQHNNKTISKYDALIKSLASEYHFDWRLIAAQINQESQFNPNAKSWAGAKGLLQVMPRTARQVGVNVNKLNIPENGIKAGLKYMQWISEQLSDELPADVKTWFTLAAYNAGLGHLKDARNLARKKGLNPDRWFGHVEKAFLLLSKPEYHKKSRYGYVRGREPVNYVKHIQALYELYSKKHPLEA